MEAPWAVSEAGWLTGLRRGTEGRLRSTRSCGVMPEEARTAPIFK